MIHTHTPSSHARSAYTFGVILLAAAALATLLPSRAAATSWDSELDVSTVPTGILSISSAARIRLYGTNDHLSIQVNTSEPVHLTLDNLRLGGSEAVQSAIACGGNTTLYLKGASTLSCGGEAPAKDQYGCVAVESGDNLFIANSPDSGDGAVGSLNVNNERAEGGPGIGGHECGAITIQSGKLTAHGGIGSPGIGGFDPGFDGMSVGDLGSVTINGGDVTAMGGHAQYDVGGHWGAGAGIGGSAKKSAGVITITGGTVSANGGYGREIERHNEYERAAAGIGGGSRADGFVAPEGAYGLRITGGTVTAHSAASAAAIGGGYEANAGAPILITGGTVIAAGGPNGAGIGGGSENSATGGGGEGGHLDITGGTVNASGGYRAAGIGGGTGGQAGTTHISGGVVEATGGESGAGIGGGYGGNTTKSGAVITIDGGTTTAIGGRHAAGIGGGEEGELGYGGEGGPVAITGGSVKAVSGSEAQDIGHGYGDATTGTLTNGRGGAVTLTHSDGYFSPTTTFVTLSQPVTTSHVSYTYRFAGRAHPDGDTGVYVYLPTGVSFNPVLALLNPLLAEVSSVTAAMPAATPEPAPTVSPAVRALLNTQLKRARAAYADKHFSEVVRTLRAVRTTVRSHSGTGIPTEKATRWTRTLDLILSHHPTYVGRVRFVGASAHLSSASKRALRADARMIVARHASQVYVGGYTSGSTHASAASNAANERLATARARTVAAYLAAQLRALGSHARVTSTGHGTHSPLRSNRTQAGRKANRRADIWMR